MHFCKRARWRDRCRLFSPFRLQDRRADVTGLWYTSSPRARYWANEKTHSCPRAPRFPRGGGDGRARKVPKTIPSCSATQFRRYIPAKLPRNGGVRGGRVVRSGNLLSGRKCKNTVSAHRRKFARSRRPFSTSGIDGSRLSPALDEALDETG